MREEERKREDKRGREKEGKREDKRGEEGLGIYLYV